MNTNTRIRQGNIKKNNFTIIPNSIAQSKCLSLKARGLMMLCLSLPNDWNYSIEGLVKIIQTDGKSSVKSALKELEEQGYLERKKLHDKNGRFIGIEYILNDEPQIDLPSTEKPLAEKPSAENQLMVKTQQNQPLAEKPLTVKPPVENQLQQNTNTQNTKYNNIININIKQIQNYINENSLSYVNADEFFSYYQQRGWKTNAGVKITNWQALLQNWNKRAKAIHDERQREQQKVIEKHGYFADNGKVQSEPLESPVATAETATSFADFLKQNGKESRKASQIAKDFIKSLAKEKEVKANV